MPGSPFTDAQGTNLVRELDAFYRDMSFGTMGYAAFDAGSAMTPVLRLPFTAAQYPLVGVGRLRSDAIAKAATLGYGIANFDMDVVCMGKVAGFSWTGQASVGAQGAFLKNAYADAGAMAHELGHNLGLNHANLWDTGGESVSGAGKEVEYGDLSDTMSTAAGYSRHFNSRYKNHLGWITDEQVATIQAGGTYRLYAMDLTNAVAGARALSFPRDSQTNLWFDFRRLHTNSPVASASAAIRWVGHGTRASLLLDTTPGSVFGVRDAFLRPGRTFSDPDSNLHVTVLGLAGTTPEALDLDVRIGPFPGNHPPVASLHALPAQIDVGTSLDFAVDASDPDGDALAYGWDFGDESIPPNAPTASHAFASAGDQIVRCVVSDRRGGVATVQAIVRVGSPSGFRVAGQILRAGMPVDGVQMVNAPTRVARTASDGIYRFANLPDGTYPLRPVLRDHAFVPAAADAVVSGADVAGPAFAAYAYADLEEVPLARTGSVWRYNDSGSDQGTAWRGTGFADGSWASGPAPLGYGESGLGTAVGYGPNANGKWITTYFRKTVPVANRGQFLALRLRLQKDDGAVVYLNNSEILRSNLPEGSTQNFLTFALEDVSAPGAPGFQTAYVPVSLLAEGNNVVAVELHQFAPGTPDAWFDLELTGLRVPVGVPAVLAAVLSPETGAVAVRLAGTPMARYRIEGSADLAVGWTPVASATAAADGTIRVELGVPGNDAIRYFRAVVE